MLKKLFRESFIYGLSGYISKFISVFLLPLYTSALTPSDYGVLDLLNSVAVFSSFLIISGTDAAVGFYFFRREFQNEKKLMVSTGLILRMSFSLTIAVILVILSPKLNNILFTDDKSYLIQLYSLYIASNAIYFFTTELLRFEMKPWIYTVFTTGNVLLNILSAVYFVLILQMGVLGAILASIISYSFFAISGIIYIVKNYQLHFSLKWIKYILAFGTPLIGTAVANWVLNYSDRYFLNYLSGLNQIGIYSVGIKVASILAMFSGAIQMSWGPFAADIQYEPNAKIIYAKVFQIYFILNIILVFNVSLFAEEILMLFTQPAYYPAKSLIPILCFSYVFIGAYFIANAGIGLTKKLHHTIWITIIAAAVNIAINSLLTPLFLAKGSAVAILAANFTIFFLTLLTSQKYYRIGYKYGLIIILMSTSSLLIWVSNAFDLKTSIKISVDFLYMGIVIFYLYKNYKDSEDFRKIVEKYRKLRGKRISVEEEFKSSEP